VDIRARSWSRRLGAALAAYAGCALVAGLVFLPVSVERAIEGVHFTDRMGTFPVEVSLCHDGRSTLDTGIFGSVYWADTGPHGFGAYARTTGPPEAGGTLASYVDPAFIEANVALINDPDSVVRAYSDQFADGLWRIVLRDELAVALIGGVVLSMVLPRRRWRDAPVRRELLIAALLVAGALAVSGTVATRLFDTWPCSRATGPTYGMSEVDRLSFASPETREVAEQVKPFIEKNLERTRERSGAYEAAAAASFATALSGRALEFAPRPGETIVLAEADPQGSFVGVHVRTRLYADLIEALGPGAVSARTIAGDVTSNGTVAESAYVAAEARVAGDVPTVAVGGDHDSTTTWQQLADAGIDMPDLEKPDVEVAGLRISGANDREHKTLFGGIITNDSGISELELGEQLRAQVDDRARIVLLHQPGAGAGYLGIDSLGSLAPGSLTTPRNDGIADLPPGIVDVGHHHEAEGPWVVWNTDGDRTTWTLVDQLGTAGGAESLPTFDRFSTPISAPLKTLMVRLHYVDVESGLATGYATISCDLSGLCDITDRVDVGLPR